MALVWLAIVFLVLAIIAYLLGYYEEITKMSMEVMKWVVLIFYIIALLLILFGGNL